MTRFFLLLITSLLFLAPVVAQQEIPIFPQPDSPLKISNAKGTEKVSKDNNNQKMNLLAANYNLQNVSGKTIWAYTIRIETGDAQFTYSENPTGVFRPGTIRSEFFGDFGYDPAKPQNLKIAVDFVKFGDGTTWGTDVSKSGERLSGIKAGIKAGQMYLKKINQANGAAAAYKALDEMVNILPPPDVPEMWEVGFKQGLGDFNRRIKRNYQKEGIKAIEEEVSKQQVF